MVKIAIGFGLLFCTLSTAVAGTRDGGGGIGVRCPASSGAPKNFELLDLHEARINGIAVSQNPQSLNDAANLVATLMGVHLWLPSYNTLSNMEISLLSVVQPILAEQSPSGIQIQTVASLPLSTDVGTYQILPGCQLEQIAYFDDSTEVLSIASNWNDLDWLDRAALVTHEVSYMTERQKALEYYATGGAMTSVRARAFVGELFSTKGLVPLADSIPTHGYAECFTGSRDPNPTSFFVYDDGAGNATAVFEIIFGYSSLYQMKTTFTGVSLNNFLNNVKYGEINQYAPLQFVNEPGAPLFSLQITTTPQSRLSFQLFQVQSTGPAPVSAPQLFFCYVPSA